MSTSIDSAGRHFPKVAQIKRRHERLESHGTKEFAIALLSGSFEKQTEYAVCFLLVVACGRDRNFEF